MIEIISGSIYNEIREKLTKKINLDLLPLYGEKEIRKISGDKYGKVKIKLDVENDVEKIQQIRDYGKHENTIKVNYFTYEWNADKNKLPKEFEKYIKPEIEKFIELLSIFKEINEEILRFSVVDGDYKDNERPGHMIATKYALIELFKQI
ncbi:hypothetical protein [Ferruginibacter sp.]|nr:hypothetical protein [Ferruginibacter sp.]